MATNKENNFYDNNKYYEDPSLDGYLISKQRVSAFVMMKGTESDSEYEWTDDDEKEVKIVKVKKGTTVTDKDEVKVTKVVASSTAKKGNTKQTAITEVTVMSQWKLLADSPEEQNEESVIFEQETELAPGMAEYEAKLLAEEEEWY